MKIEINPAQLERLFRSGLIHPSDVSCLDSESKEILKALCLEMCLPNQCQRCSAQTLCQSKLSLDELSQWQTVLSAN